MKMSKSAWKHVKGQLYPVGSGARLPPSGVVCLCMASMEEVAFCAGLSICRQTGHIKYLHPSPRSTIPYQYSVEIYGSMNNSLQLRRGIFYRASGVIEILYPKISSLVHRVHETPATVLYNVEWGLRIEWHLQAASTAELYQYKLLVTSLDTDIAGFESFVIWQANSSIS